MELYIAPVIGDPPPAAKPKKAKKTAGNRFRVINTFIDGTMKDLNLNERAVWFLLWRDTKDGVAAVSQTAIAKRAGVCSRTVNRVVKRLAEKGLLKVVYQGGYRRGVSVYRVFATGEK